MCPKPGTAGILTAIASKRCGISVPRPNLFEPKNACITSSELVPSEEKREPLHNIDTGVGGQAYRSMSWTKSSGRSSGNGPNVLSALSLCRPPSTASISS
jgi:hypothetical protein